MAKRSKNIDNETVFEKYFLSRLEVNGGYKSRIGTEISINKDLCLFFNDLEAFLLATQKASLKKLQDQLGYDWKKVFTERFQQELKTKRLFELLKDGIEINGIALDLLYFFPERESNQEQRALAEQNRFTAVRQWYFGEETGRKDKSIDIVLLINGFAVVTIELKNEATSGNADAAVMQYLGRPLNLPIFSQPFLHLAVGNHAAKMATAFSKPATEKDFRHFNKDLVNEIDQENEELKKEEYPIYYLYYDILLPKSLLNFIEKYLYTKGEKRNWIFPRYHQQRATRIVTEAVKGQFKKTGELDNRFLIQHSTGSGKSMTIVWLAQNLRNAFVGDTPLFDSVLILTDRINLDDQISKDFRQAILSEGVAEYADTTKDLKKALEDNKKVIVSTIHKFSHLRELGDQSQKRICVIIDEAHRSQGGNLHDAVTDTFTTDKDGVEAELPDKQEQVISEIAKKRFPNMAFIALTATPSPNTLKQFGEQTKFKTKDGKDEFRPHDVYSMDQAINEGYIMDVAKNIYAYDTLLKLNKEVNTAKEYLPLQVRKALRQKAYENSEIIKEKCELMIRIFKKESAMKIGGKAKAMVVTSSRLAAVKYKLFMDKALKKQNLDFETMVAFSGKIKFGQNEYTEEGMNKALNPKNEKIEDIFEKGHKIRFLIVANKFQTGYNEPLLHTMFIDKPLRGRNAVQTLSRLNRIHPNKKDTLAVDFTGSYEQIMKAYKYYQKTVVTNKTTDPNVLFEIKNVLLKFGVFTLLDVKEIIEHHESGLFNAMPKIAGRMTSLKGKFTTELDREKRDAFRTLMNRYLASFNYIKTFYKIPQKELWDLQVFLIYLNNRLTDSDHDSLKKEIEEVKVINHSIPEIEVVEDTDDDDSEDGGGTGGGSGGATVRINKTVNEVIEEINLKFAKIVGGEGVEAIADFLGDVLTDADLLEMIKNNRTMDAAELYEKIVREEMEKRLSDYLIDGMTSERYSYDIYDKIVNDQVRPYVNRMAFNLMRGQING